jgi:hypothetical protein
LLIEPVTEVELVTFRHLLNKTCNKAHYSPAEINSAGEPSEVELVTFRYLLNNADNHEIKIVLQSANKCEAKSFFLSLI